MKSRLLVLAIMVGLIFALGIPHVALADTATWTPTGSMDISRRDHAAPLLLDGRVLIVGSNPAELYDPTTGTFTLLSNTNFFHGSNHTVTRLANGFVLIVGGRFAPRSAEFYAPRLGIFAVAGSPRAGHWAHTATLLLDGRILIVAGHDNIIPQTHAVAELYDPSTSTFSLTGSLNEDRGGHTATLLANGQVLITGGGQTTSPGGVFSLRVAELYDPATGTFTLTGSTMERRNIHTATLLPNGKVLIVGSLGFSAVVAELYDPATGTFSPTLGIPERIGGHTATLLPNGQVLIAGGFTAVGPVTTNSAELYDPVTDTFTATTSMGTARQQHTATLLPDGRVLVTGGFNPTDGNVSSAEIFSLPRNAPDAFIKMGPSGTAAPSSVTFSFSGSDEVTPVEDLVYASRLVPLEPTFSSFSSSTSRTFSNLANGDYTFYVKARDEEGNEDLSPDRRSFSVDESVLVANFMNGNNDFLNSRVYLWNPAVSARNVSVRVFTLERTGSSTLLGTVDLGSLEAFSGRNIKLAEDILLPLEIPLPYTADGGNLTLEFTVAGSVRGAAQVFSSDLGFGTYPLQKIPSTSSGSPTVLVANFMNGNNAALNSRVYLWNPSTSAGEVTVRVFTLPPSGGLAQELPGSPLDLGTLGARSALNVKLAEDILAPLGIPLPYRDDDGDLTLEFTIQAAGVRGATQVFSSSLAFGTNPLQQIPSTLGTSPTVLVANFMNGNDAVFNSRVYLFNPSQSAGAVTVRVFTLPLSGDLVQELTNGPFNLGILGAKSALNVKLAEDILTPLEITTPYITDGGNLVVEFTVEAADVRGSAQVFSSDFAFGVYPLQQIPSVLSGSPTVLVANFLNGNNDAFNSRVYLWNPSDSPGNVSVQVFSLPLNTGVAQELTGRPLNLGTLGAKSALNVKLAEDILIPLGISTPHIIDGGNLTLEFKIEAADVRGAAQVFSDSFGFGTYPLEVIPESSGSGAFEVLQDTVSIEEIAPGVVKISGAVKNKDFQDAFSVDVAIAAFDSSGKMLGGNTTSITGTPRKQDGVVTNSGLLKDEVGYFSSIFEVEGTVHSAEFSVAAEGLATSPPLANLQVIFSTFGGGAPFSIAPATVIVTTEVSGTIRNDGPVTAELISVDLIFLDSQGRVLAVDSTIPDQSTLPPGTSSTFRGIGLIPPDQVASVVFSFDWLEE